MTYEEIVEQVREDYENKKFSKVWLYFGDFLIKKHNPTLKLCVLHYLLLL